VFLVPLVWILNDYLGNQLASLRVLLQMGLEVIW
jgi:hypothetical protein